jgi:hypothetical protein
MCQQKHEAIIAIAFMTKNHLRSNMYPVSHYSFNIFDHVFGLEYDAYFPLINYKNKQNEVSDIHRNWDKIFEKQDSDMFRRAHSRFIPTEQQIVKLFNCNLTVNDITLKTNLNVNDNENDQSDNINKSVDHTTTTPTNNEFVQIDNNQNCATNSDKMRRQTDTKHISYNSRALNKSANT